MNEKTEALITLIGVCIAAAVLGVFFVFVIGWAVAALA